MSTDSPASKLLALIQNQGGSGSLSNALAMLKTGEKAGATGKAKAKATKAGAGAAAPPKAGGKAPAAKTAGPPAKTTQAPLAAAPAQAEAKQVAVKGVKKEPTEQAALVGGGGGIDLKAISELLGGYGLSLDALVAQAKKDTSGTAASSDREHLDDTQPFDAEAALADLRSRPQQVASHTNTSTSTSTGTCTSTSTSTNTSTSTHIHISTSTSSGSSSSSSKSSSNRRSSSRSNSSSSSSVAVVAIRAVVL